MGDAQAMTTREYSPTVRSNASGSQEQDSAFTSFLYGLVWLVFLP